MKRSLFLILIAVLVMIMGSFAFVSAQDVDNMSNAELTTLLLQIMQRLDGSGEAAEMPEPTATPTPEPTKTPQPELSDDPAELEALLMAIMQKLQQEEPNDVPDKSAGVSISAGDPGEEAVNSIWEDKKLIIEALPGYMFIQPPRPVQSEPETGPQPDNRTEPTPVPGTVCDPNFPDFCFWWPVDGQVVCVCGELG